MDDTFLIILVTDFTKSYNHRVLYGGLGGGF